MKRRISYQLAASLYLGAAIRAERKYVEEKANFTAITESYTEKIAASNATALLNAAHKASTDPRRVKAGGDAAWAREEAAMYAGLAQLAWEMVKAGCGPDLAPGYWEWDEVNERPQPL